MIFVGWTGPRPTTTCMCRTRTADDWQGAGCLRGWTGSPASMSWSPLHADEPAEVVIGIETDRGLFVAALVAAGYQVYAVNPMSTSRYRDRHSASRRQIRSRRRQGPGGHGPHRPAQPPARGRRQRDRSRRSRSWPAPTSRWSGRGAARPTCCARRCGSSTPPPWSPSMTWPAATRSRCSAIAPDADGRARPCPARRSPPRCAAAAANAASMSAPPRSRRRCASAAAARLPRSSPPPWARRWPPASRSSPR